MDIIGRTIANRYEIISKTGFFKDISHELTEKNRSMDYLINGFIKNSKLALLIEPVLFKSFKR